MKLTTGAYWVAVTCPNCARTAEVPAVIEQVLKVKGHEGSLTVALSAKAVPHDCQQTEIDGIDQGVIVDLVTGEISS